MLKKTFFFISLVWLAALCCGATPVNGPPTEADAGPAPSEAKPPDPFRVLDIGERNYQGGAAIAVVLSRPLDPTTRHDPHLRISNPQSLLKSAWVLSADQRTLYFPHVEPETEYSVTVLEGLRAADGDKLGKRVSQVVTTRKISPVVSFASNGLVLPSEIADGLPVVTVNIPEVEVEFFRFNEKGLTDFIYWEDTTDYEPYYWLNEAREYAELVYSGRFDLDPPPNRRTVCHLPIQDIPALQTPGVYLAVMRQPGQYDYRYQVSHFLVTDIGLHVRIYEDQSLILANSLKSGTPLADVKLRFFKKKGEMVREAKTDPFGRYRLDQPLPGDIRLIQARLGDQISILSFDFPALDMSDFDLGDRPYRPREIFAYGPRDLYRPGESVTVAALLRDADGRIIETRPLQARLIRPDGRQVKRFTWHPYREEGAGKASGTEPEPGGYYQTQLDLPVDAQTGVWTLRLYDDPAAKSPVGEYRFHVEAFLPERMKLELESGTDYPAIHQDIAVKVRGEYLYGAPAAGNRLESKVRVRAQRELFSRYKGFEFGLEKEADYREYWERDPVQLDASGQATLRIENRWKDLKSPLSVLVVGELFESGGRPVVRGLDQTVWPEEALVGIRPGFDGHADEGPVEFSLIKLTQTGTMVPAQDLMIELVKEERDYYWEYSEDQGWEHRYTEKVYSYLSEHMDLDGDNPGAFKPVLEGGQYLLSVTDPASDFTTSLRFRVGRFWWYDADGGSARPDQVVLKTDQDRYRPGDSIRLTVTPPHDGHARILVEGNQPLWSVQTPVSSKGTTVEIPVSAAWKTHNLYISAVVFRSVRAEEKITPARSVGLLHLPLDRSDRKLAIAVEAPEKIVPQSEVTATVQLAEGANTPVFVTLALVDIGILNITDYQTPDPFDWFFKRRRFSVTAYDLYNRVIESLDGQTARLRFGGDADLARGKRPDTEVELLSRFQGPVLLDENGQAKIRFELPDFNGRVRLMALAFTPDRFGCAETEMTVAAPVVTQLATPRFLSPGDQSQFTLDVHNLSGEAKDIELRLSAGDPLRLSQGQRDLHLADGEKTSLRFPVNAHNIPGASTIRLNLNTPGYRLSRDWQLGTRPGYPAITRKVRQVVQPDGFFTLDPVLIQDLIPETVVAELKISPTIPLNMADAARGLIQYPYGCLEQVTSRAYPLLFATPENIQRYGLPEISRGDRIQRLKNAINRISSMQLASGGFGLWHMNSPEEPWLTAYASEFLLIARKRGMDIPSGLLDKALKRLESYLKKEAPLSDYMEKGDREALQFAVRAYAGYVLSRVNRAPLGSLRPLYDGHHGDAAASLPLAHIGLALQKMGDTLRASAALQKAAQLRREGYGYWGDYGSPVRDLAWTVALMAENKAQSVSGFEKLLLDLDDGLRGRQWLSTQEKFAVFRAGMALSPLSQQQWAGTLSVLGQESSLDPSGPYLLSPDPGRIAGGISFFPRHDKLLYVSAVINGYTRTPPEPDDSQIALKRELYDMQGKPIDSRRFFVGDLVIVHLTVSSSQNAPDGLVVDLLPAGFELENQNLKHSVKLEDIQIEGRSLWRLKEQAGIRHEEYLDDRYVAALRLSERQRVHLFYLMRAVSPGTFTVPPPFAESMYRPEIRGIGRTPEPITIVNQGHESGS